MKYQKTVTAIDVKRHITRTVIPNNLGLILCKVRAVIQISIILAWRELISALSVDFIDDIVDIWFGVNCARDTPFPNILSVRPFERAVSGLRIPVILSAKA